MAVTCKHGGDIRWCSICQVEIEKEPLSLDAFRITVDGNPVVVLRELAENRVKIMRLKPKRAILEIAGDNVSNCIADACDAREKRRILLRFQEIALKNGFIFIPTRPLTRREQSEDGPTHCYKCGPKVTLSLTTGSLGCTQCRYYVCRCGRCLCGYTGGFNYRRESMPSYSELRCTRAERLEYVRVVLATMPLIAPKNA